MAKPAGADVAAGDAAALRQGPLAVAGGVGLKRVKSVRGSAVGGSQVGGSEVGSDRAGAGGRDARILERDPIGGNQKLFHPIGDAPFKLLKRSKVTAHIESPRAFRCERVRLWRSAWLLRTCAPPTAPRSHGPDIGLAFAFTLALRLPPFRP